MKPERDTPQRRRRQVLTRESVFVASMAGREVQRRFLSQKRIAFTLAVLLGLAAMWILALQTGGQRTFLRWPLFAASACFFLLSAAIRSRSRWVQAASFYFGFITLGGAVGTLGPPGNALLNPTILVGLTILGASINTVVFRKDRTRLAEFLLTAPWLVIACVIVFFLPAGEWVLLASGATAVLLLLMLFVSAEVSLQIFEPREHFFAAADVVPIVFLMAWRRWTGQT